MIFDYSEAQRVARLFRINFPIKEEELKKAYRALCREFHPDIAKGIDEKYIKEINAGYEYLCSLEGSAAYTDEDFTEKIQTTIHGKPLYEFGKGLGPLINGRECDWCKGLGYHKYEEYKYEVVCPHKTCKDCQGTGKFKQRNSGRVVTCRACNGSGKGSVYDIGLGCVQCMFEGTTSQRVPTGKCSYNECLDCKGTGEIRIFNPVLPKGRVMSRK